MSSDDLHAPREQAWANLRIDQPPPADGTWYWYPAKRRMGLVYYHRLYDSWTIRFTWYVQPSLDGTIGGGARHLSEPLTAQLWQALAPVELPAAPQHTTPHDIEP